MTMTRSSCAATAAAILAVSIGLTGCSASTVDPSPSPSYDQVAVTRGDLSTTLKWTGTLTYDNPFPVVYQTATATTSTSRAGSTSSNTSATSIVTWIAAPGSELTSGDILYRVNDVPVVFLEGDGVLWRTLSVGSEGSDVTAVETALESLGYDPNSVVVVDTHYRSSTWSMVKRFQTAMGFTENGTFDYRSVVMRPGPVVVTDVSLAVGDTVASGDTVLTVSDVTRAVTFSIAPEERPQVEAGDPVEVRLPSGGTATAMVSLVSDSLDATSQTYAVTAVIADPIPVTGDKLDVSVSFTVPIATNALLVPPKALIVRDDGTTSVRVVKNDELTWVDVTVLGTSGQSTAVESDGLTEGDIVAVN
jgi:multidrug efflux system membrane fusion protein